MQVMASSSQFDYVVLVYALGTVYKPLLLLANSKDFDGPTLLAVDPQWKIWADRLQRKYITELLEDFREELAIDPRALIHTLSDLQFGVVRTGSAGSCDDLRLRQMAQALSSGTLQLFS